MLCDPQTSLAYGLSRVGLAVTPGEAHWQLGGVEVAVKATKKTMKKIRSQEPNLRAAISGGTLGGNGCQPHAEGERAHYERDELVLDEPRRFTDRRLQEKPSRGYTMQPRGQPTISN